MSAFCAGAVGTTELKIQRCLQDPWESKCRASCGIKCFILPPPPPPPPSPSPSPQPSSPPCVDTTKCKKNKCKNYNAAKLKQCKKTCGLCEPLPPSAPPSPPPPPALPEVDCSDLKDKKKCKIKMKKCKTKKQLIKCGKKCKKDKKKPKCQKTCCELGFPV